jgi:hypothetical protein
MELMSKIDELRSRIYLLVEINAEMESRGGIEE